jgi:hypothetical protein
MPQLHHDSTHNVDYMFVLTEFVQRRVTSAHNLFPQMHLSHS